jgi:hypothetical protein
VAEEAVCIKKERLNKAEQKYEEDHRTFTVFSKVKATRRDVGATL